MTDATLTRDRFQLVPWADPAAEGLTIIWDRQEEQVIDVMTASEVAAYLPEGL